MKIVNKNIKITCKIGYFLTLTYLLTFVDINLKK